MRNQSLVRQSKESIHVMISRCGACIMVSLACPKNELVQKNISILEGDGRPRNLQNAWSSQGTGCQIPTGSAKESISTVWTESKKQHQVIWFGTNLIHNGFLFRLLNEMPDEDWGMPDICLQKTAEVVFIAEQKNCRAAMGQLKVRYLSRSIPNSCSGYGWWESQLGSFLSYRFSYATNADSQWSASNRILRETSRLSTIHIRCSYGGLAGINSITIKNKLIYQATAQFARGKLERTLGEAGDIDAETEGLLIENSIDTREFSHAVLSCLPISESSQWQIDEKVFLFKHFKY